tara:strand:- start:736 stop:1176 length:441 start_codon:yes stop_codon:yes gene_type:complete
MFDLVLTAVRYAKEFFGDDDRPRDLPEVKRGESRADSFLNVESALDAYSTLRKKNETPAFQVANFERPRPVSQLTNPKPFQPLGNMRFITGAENADLQNAMRVLSNAQNKQVAQVIPYSSINYKGGPSPNIAVGSTTLPKRTRTIT